MGASTFHASRTREYTDGAAPAAVVAVGSGPPSVHWRRPPSAMKDLIAAPSIRAFCFICCSTRASRRAGFSMRFARNRVCWAFQRQ